MTLVLVWLAAGPAGLAQGGPPAGPEPQVGRPDMPMPGMPMMGPGRSFGPDGRAGMRRRNLQSRNGMGGQAGGGNLQRLLRSPEVQKELGLTEDQLKKLEEVAFSAGKAAIQERANLQVQRLELARLMRADSPDRSAIDKKLQEISQADLGLSRARVNALLDARGVLTKPQRDKLAQFIRNRMAGPPQGQAQPPGQQNPRPPAGQAPGRRTQPGPAQPPPSGAGR